MDKKLQSSIEFIMLSTFMLLTTVGFFGIISTTIVDSQEESNTKISEDILMIAYNEIATAKLMSDGYSRVFFIPQKVDGVDFNITLIGGRELVVNYLDIEYVKFLPANVTGNLTKGYNTISKINGVIYLGNILQFFGGDLVITNGAFNVARFQADGQLILKGSLQQNGIPTPSAVDEFIFNDRNGITMAVVNLANGNMVIRGSLFESQPVLNPNPANNDFVIRDEEGNVVAYIEETGNLYLKRILTQSGEP